MALVLEALTFVQQTINAWRHPAPQKNDSPLKVGVLSTATINVAGIIQPSKTHADVVLWGVASRDEATAKSYATKHGFKKHYASYDSLLADPDIDFVYISLPNALHFEWAAKSLGAGKHVLLEKPFTSNALEAEALVKLAEEKRLVLMEAFHWFFHPAAHRFRQILDSGHLGKIVKTDARMTATPAVPKGDIRWQYDLSGGSLMDLSYVVSFTRFALHASTPDKVLFAKAYPAQNDARVDASMHATLRFNRSKNAMGAGQGSERGGGGGEDDVYSTIYTDFARSWLKGLIPRVWELPSIRVETEHAEVYFYNAQCPHLYHYIAVTDKATGRTTYEQCYKGGPNWKERGERYWSTYRYQLESFVDKVRGREPVWWCTGEESIEEMKTVDEVYRAAGLPIRPTSEWLLRP